LLVIRAEQMAAFEGELRELSEERLLVRFAGKFGMSDEERRALVRRGVRKAEQYGITSDAEVATFIEWMVKEGEEFDTDPQRPIAGEILRDGGLPASVKLWTLAERHPWRKPAPNVPVED
jgi:hypothetical protein